MAGGSHWGRLGPAGAGWGRLGPVGLVGNSGFQLFIDHALFFCLPPVMGAIGQGSVLVAWIIWILRGAGRKTIVKTSRYHFTGEGTAKKTWG